MLKRVKVKNVALIDVSEVEFSDHLNILTGETGAGKSILIDAIHLALGGKADKGIIRSGAEFAFVELEFQVKSDRTIQQLRALDIFVQEDGSVILQRRITQTKSTFKINGEMTTARNLKEAASLLIDIHGQHEHQSLLDEKRHRQLLDAYCAEHLQQPKKELADVYKTFCEAEKKLAQATRTDADREREISFAQFEVKEIADAALTDGEDEQLEAEFQKMEHVRVIGESVTAALSCLENFDAEGALSLVSNAGKSLQQAVRFDEELKEQADALTQSEDMLHETVRSLQRYADTLEVDERRYTFVSQRLDTINHLKKKYGGSIEKILQYAEQRQDYLNQFENFEQYKEELTVQRDAAKEKLDSLCAAVSKIRQNGAKRLSADLQQALKDLNFMHVAFETQVETAQAHLSAEGCDLVRFMISLNAGEPLKPLSQVASGGELSRIMLALKAVMADQEEIESLIFDEIDAGISGRTAWKVSEKLAVLGCAHQVICITHLPQIAAMADQHFLIEKNETEASTQTNLTQLDKEGQILEIARLLGGGALTQAVYTNAKELKDMATNTKAY